MSQRRSFATLIMACFLAAGCGQGSKSEKSGTPPAKSTADSSAPKDTSGTPAAASDAKKETLYKRLGGEAAIKAVVNEFIDVLSNDAVLNANPKIEEARKRVNPDELKAKVTALLCQVTGGPQKYTGRSMKEAHANMNISGSEWNQMVKDFVMVLDKFKVPKPEQEELLKIVGTTKGDIVLRPNE